MGGFKSMKHLFLCCLSSFLMAVTSCENHGDESHNKHGDHHSLMDQLPSNPQDSIEYDEAMKALMDDLEKVLVDLPQNKALGNTPPPSAKNTFVLTRTPHLEAFPCSNCHKEVPNKLTNDEQDAHWNIQLNHAGIEVMNCNSCHNLDQPNNLISLTGVAIDINHSYQLCAQCHSSQAKDWLGGAHGKRAIGWISPRVINSCVSCHNPHQPQIQKRWPARLNTIKLIERND